MIAYVCRYGHQPLSEVKAMSQRELRELTAALSRLVERESPEAHTGGGA